MLEDVRETKNCQTDRPLMPAPDTLYNQALSVLNKLCFASQINVFINNISTFLLDV